MDGPPVAVVEAGMPNAAPQVEIQKFSEWFGALERSDYRRLKQVGCRLEVFFHTDVVPFQPSVFRFKIVNNTPDSISWRVVQNLRLSNECFLTISPSKGLIERKRTSAPISVTVVLFHSLTLKHMLYVECTWGSLGKTFYLPIGLNVKPSLDTSASYWDLQIPTTDQLSLMGYRQGGSIFLCTLHGAQVVMKTWVWGSKDSPPPGFQKQLTTFLSLNHPNLTRFIGAHSGACEASIVMEHSANGSLADFFAGRSTPVSKSMDVRCTAALDAARALAYLHSKGKVHTLISGRSVLLDEEMKGKLASFGHIEDAVEAADFVPASNSPEDAINYRSRAYNCFQFGQFLWELLTGRPQEESLSVANLIYSNSKPDPSTGFPTMAPVNTWMKLMIDTTPHLQLELLQTYPDFVILMLRCLSPDPRDRPGIVDIVGELNTICDTPQPRTMYDMNLSTNLTLRDEHLALLPRTLVSLDLACNRQITANCIAYLPLTLQRLTLAKHSVVSELAESFMSLIGNSETSRNFYKIIQGDALVLPKWVLAELSLAGMRAISNLNVKSFEVTNAAQFSDAHLKFLPRSIVHLHFDSLSGTSITDEGIKLLPQNLQSLTLPSLLLSSNTAKYLPQSLTILRLPNTSQFTSEYELPPNLTTLSIGNSSLFSNFAKLPRSITELNLGQAPNFTDNDVPKLPENLASLTISENNALTSKSIAHLPRTLTFLRISGNTNFGIALKDDEWPPGLLSLELTDNVSIAAGSSKPSPKDSPGYRITLRKANDRNETSLNGTMNNRENSILNRDGTTSNSEFAGGDQIVLPPALTRLELPANEHITNSCVLQLPRTITSLEVSDETYLTEGGLPNLPPQLVTLNVVIPSTYVKDLPRRLTSLNIERCHTLVDGCLSDLPAGLIFLKLTCSRITNAGLVYLPQKLLTLHLIDMVYITDAGIKHLPAGLTKLIIDDGSMLTTACFSSLPRGLTNLVLPPNLMNDATDDAIGELPRLITELNLERNENITNMGIIKLPRTLTSLNLANNENLTDMCIKYMPRSLVYLNVAMSDYLSPSCLPDLPACHTLVLPSRLSNSLKDKNISDLPRLLSFWDMEHNRDATARSFQYLPRTLTRLNLSLRMVRGLNDVRAKYLPPVLTELDLARNTTLTDAGIPFLPVPLTSLNLYWNTNLTDEAIQLLPRGLTYLNLGCSDQLTDACGKYLPRQLLELLIDGNSNFTDAFIAQLPRSLAFLDLSHAYKLTADALIHMPPSLTAWEVSPNFLNSIPPSYIQHVPRSLLKLNMWGNMLINDACLGALPAGLTYLNVGAASALSNYAIPFLPNTLKTLILEENRLLEDSSISYLPRGITHLNLASSGQLTENSGRYFPPNLLTLDLSTNTLVTDAWIAMLPRTLQSLSVQCALKLTIECLPVLPSNLLNFDMPKSLIASISSENALLLPRSLTTLNLWCNSQLTNVGVKALPKVTSLNLAQNNVISDSGLPLLPHALVSLTLSANMKITNAGIRDLPKSLTELNLSFAPLTDEGIKHLPRNLRRLNIGKAKLTDACIPDMPPHLVQLTSKGLSKDLLRKHLPQLKSIDS